MQLADAHLANQTRFSSSVIVIVSHRANAGFLKFPIMDKLSPLPYPRTGIKYHPFRRLFRLWKKSLTPRIHRTGTNGAPQSGHSSGHSPWYSSSSIHLPFSSMRSSQFLQRLNLQFLAPSQSQEPLRQSCGRTTITALISIRTSVSLAQALPQGRAPQGQF